MSSAKVLRVNLAEVASFTAAAPVAGSTWVHVPVLDYPLPKLMQQADTAQEANSRGTESLDYATVKSSGYDFQLRCMTGTKGFDGTGGDTDPTACFAQKLLESYHGVAANAGSNFVGTTLAVGGTTSIPKLTSATNATVGMAMGFCQTASSANNDMEVRFISTLSGVDATVDQAITSAAAGNLVYGAFNFSPTLGDRTGAYHYLNVELDGHSWLLGVGRTNGLKINVNATQGVRLGMQFMGDTYASGVTPTTFTANTFTGAPLVGAGGTIDINGTITRIAGFSADLKLDHQWISASANSTADTALNGRAGAEIVTLGASGDWQEYYTTGRWTQKASRTNIPLRFVIPTGSTNAAKGRGTLALWVPNAQIDVDESPLNSQVGQKVKWTAKDPTSTQVTNGITKPYYLAFFGGV